MVQGYTADVVEALGVISLAAIKVLRELMPDATEEALLLLIQRSSEEILAEESRSRKIQILVRGLFQELLLGQHRGDS